MRLHQNPGDEVGKPELWAVGRTPEHGARLSSPGLSLLPAWVPRWLCGLTRGGPTSSDFRGAQPMGGTGRKPQDASSALCLLGPPGRAALLNSSPWAPRTPRAVPFGSEASSPAAQAASLWVSFIQTDGRRSSPGESRPKK